MRNAPMMTVASSNAPVSFRCPTPPPTGQPMDTVNDLAVTLRQHQGFASLMAVMTRRGSAVPVFDISVSPGTKFLRTVTVTTRLDHSSGELPATPSWPSFSGAASPTCRERSAGCGSACGIVSARSTRNRSDGIIKYRTPAPIPGHLFPAPIPLGPSSAIGRLGQRLRDRKRKINRQTVRRDSQILNTGTSSRHQ